MINRSNERLPMVITLGMFVVLAQLGCLVAIGFYSWRELFSPASPFGDYPDIYSAVIFRGEVYYRVLDMKTNGNRERVRAFDLKTGHARDAFTPQFLTNRGWVADGQRLWGIGDREIMETDGTTSVTHRPKRLLNTTSGMAGAFLYEGHPAILDRDASDADRLLVLVDGEWEDKGQVAMPGANRVWAFDEQRGENVLVPRTSDNSTTTKAAGAWRWTRVVLAGGEYHLFQVEFSTAPRPAASGGVLYRKGFDFVSRWADGDAVSALAPENAPTDATGWTRVETTGEPYGLGMAALGDDVILAGGDGYAWKREAAGDATRSPTFVKSKGLSANLRGQVCLLSPPDSPELYAVTMTRDFGFKAFQYHEPLMREMPYRVEGFAGWMVRFWQRLLLKVLGVLVVGTLLLLAVGSRLMPRPDESSHSFGLPTVQLAPLGRRLLARAIDFVLLLAPMTIQLAWLISRADSETLYSAVVDRYAFHHNFPEHYLYFLIALLWAVVLFVMMVRYEGRYGVTPGKWLCGVRTLRTTLRPCGFARALLRELLMWFDTPLLLTVLPGMMCLLITDRRQRLGDLIADTIVVDHRATERP